MTNPSGPGWCEMPEQLAGWNEDAHSRRLRRLSGASHPVMSRVLTRLPALASWRSNPAVLVAVAGLLALAGAVSMPVLFPCGVGRLCHVSRTLNGLMQNPAILDGGGRVLGYMSDRWGPAVRRDEAPLCLDALRNKEDRGLYARSTGFDLPAIGRAVRDNLLATRVVSGASTYEQQVARTVFPLAWSGMWRKLAEASIATLMRLRYGPSEIESFYAAVIYMGRGVHGLEPAARSYFGKPLSRLSAGECALLSVLPAAPGRRDPEDFYTSADSARRFGLARMVDAGLITEATMRAELLKPITHRSAAFPGSISLLRKLRAEAAGCRFAADEVRTTVAGALQEMLAAEAMRHHDPDQAFDAVAIRPSGAVLAWIGSPETPAQIGSLLKPFEAAIGEETGVAPLEASPSTLIWPSGGREIERWIKTQRRGCFDALTVSSALGPSEKCTFLRVHAALAREGELRRTASFGLPTAAADPAAALGLMEVPLTKVAAAYSAFVGHGQMGAVSGIPGCGPAPLPAPITPQTADRIFVALQRTLTGSGTLAHPASRYWGSRRVTVAGKTGSSERTHSVILMTDDLILALRLRSERPLPGVAGTTLGPTAIRILRGWYDHRS